MTFTPRPSLVVLSLAALASGLALAAPPPQERPDRLPLDMSVWYRRDYAHCRGAGRVGRSADTLTITADHSALKYWQIPTLAGPLPINERWGWVRRCDRPPGAFASDARRQAEAGGVAIDVADYPYISWRWRISHTVDDSRTANDDGKIQRAGDDFAAKVGIQMLPKGGDDLREIAFVWARSIPEGTTLVQEAGALFWRFSFYRVVAESGDEHVGEWRLETRNLVDEYRRIWPDEEPGILLRVFLMTDGDNTGTRVTASYSDLVLHRAPPDEFTPER